MTRTCEVTPYGEVFGTPATAECPHDATMEAPRPAPAAWLPGTLLAVAAFLACLRVGDMAPVLPDELTVECVGRDGGGGCYYRPLAADAWTAFLSAATVLPLLARDSRPGPAAHTSFPAAAGLSPHWACATAPRPRSSPTRRASAPTFSIRVGDM
jgi:hypothetical protein